MQLRLILTPMPPAPENPAAAQASRNTAQLSSAWTESGRAASTNPSNAAQMRFMIITHPQKFNIQYGELRHGNSQSVTVLR